MPDFSKLAQLIAIWAVPVLLAITVHEVAHGYAARALGDDTAERAGRLSLNPLRHIDRIGTVLIPAILLLIKAPFLFGWAKPVPVRFDRLRAPLRDMALVAAAGPASNLVMALGWCALLWMGISLGAANGPDPVLRDMSVAGVSINVVLMVVNLIPLPPLDGGRIAVGVLPRWLARPLSRLEPWGMVILIALMVTGLLGQLIYLPMTLVEGLIYQSFGIAVLEP